MVSPLLVHESHFPFLKCQANISQALFVATTCLFVRTVFRSVELSGGFSGKLANNEVEFMVLDGVMVIVASAAMTIMHPGRAFGKRWPETRFSWSLKKKDHTEASQPTTTEDSSPTSGEKATPGVSTVAA